MHVSTANGAWDILTTQETCCLTCRDNSESVRAHTATAPQPHRWNQACCHTCYGTVCSLQHRRILVQPCANGSAGQRRACVDARAVVKPVPAVRLPNALAAQQPDLSGQALACARMQGRPLQHIMLHRIDARKFTICWGLWACTRLICHNEVLEPPCRRIRACRRCAPAGQERDKVRKGRHGIVARHAAGEEPGAWAHHAPGALGVAELLRRCAAHALACQGARGTVFWSTSLRCAYCAPAHVDKCVPACPSDPLACGNTVG